MEPISSLSACLSVADAGVSVAKILKTTYKNYKGAEREILDVAHELEICRGLIIPFGEHLEARTGNYPDTIKNSVQHLIIRVGCPTSKFVHCQDFDSDSRLEKLSAMSINLYPRMEIWTKDLCRNSSMRLERVRSTSMCFG